MAGWPTLKVGARVIDAIPDNSVGPGWVSYLHIAVKPPAAIGDEGRPRQNSYSDPTK
jgi:hypothetical protein